MKPGLNAIMGPPGGGKSLLLGLLAARKKPTGLSGDVWVHGVPKCNSGYVVQDDVVMSTLSVRENIQFSAFLRLPTTMSNKEKNNRISKVIKKLGLSEVADSKQGTCFVKSKGERKMVSIGMELILDPSILFLDEPTTGLDWNTAYKIIKLLKSLSEQEKTIIFSIHQPRYSFFNMFDSLTLLASEKLMYHGPAQEALEYFKSAGYKSECYIIPEEFFLDIITGIIKRESEDHEASNTEMSSTNEKSVIEALADFYEKSPICGETNSELERLSKDQNKRSLFGEEITYVTSFGHQLIQITWRSFQSLVHHPQPWIVQSRGALLPDGLPVSQQRVSDGILCEPESALSVSWSLFCGIMKPGFNAIVGPQGGGKSLLLDILAARKEPRVLYENVRVHEVPHPDNFQCNSGYVVQDDVMMSTLTVRENMWFSASLRLPTTMSKKEKNERIKKVIEKLGLCEVADSKSVDVFACKMWGRGRSGVWPADARDAPEQLQWRPRPAGR
ncbi:broad substrate specificity ATP-binding cassette transporter ABCG2-like [Urocitellus parryii]